MPTRINVWNVWKSFPSVHLPDGLTTERLTEYFLELPPITYATGFGVLSILQPENADTDSEYDSEDEDDEDIENYTDELRSEPVDFSYHCRKAVLNCIARWERYLKYGFVIKCSVVNAERNAHYFLKAQVKASMESDLRFISVTISKTSGDICVATCTCKANALKRCSHIAAVVFHILDHISIQGHDGKNYQYILTINIAWIWETSGII